MLVLFLLNAVGFYGIFVGLQFKYAQEANEKLDDDQYPDEAALTFKVPLSVPYSVDQPNFERVTGEFEHQGEVYRLVKQKLYHDTLYIVCVKDANSKQINQALSAYVKTFADQPLNPNPTSKLIQSLIKDYLLAGTIIESQSIGWENQVVHVGYHANYFFLPFYKIKYPPKSSFLS